MTTIRELVLIGSRQLQIIWEDGHQWGLYPWELLQHLSQEQLKPAAGNN